MEFTIRNDGGAETGPLTVSLPQVPWLSTGIAEPMASLEPDASTKVVLILSPTADMPLGEYNGQIGINGTSCSLIVPVSFRLLSDAVGDLVVTVTDEYTYYAEGSPKVAGAEITLTDAIDGQVVRTGSSDGEGRFGAAGLREGYYTLRVNAEAHAKYEATVLIEAGNTRLVNVFIARELVTYTWSVVPSSIEGSTQVTLEATFETNVPVPVVTVEPNVIDLASLTTVGQQLEIPMTITNHGLIAAEDVTLDFGDHPFYSIEPLISGLGVLPARSSLTVPVLVRRIGDFDQSAECPTFSSAADGMPEVFPLGTLAVASGEDPVPCWIASVVLYRYWCGPDGIWRSVPIGVVNVDGHCPPPPPGSSVPPSGFHGDPGGGSVIAHTPPSTTTDSCKPEQGDDCTLLCQEVSLDYTGGLLEMLAKALRRIPGLRDLDLSLSGGAELCVCCDLSISVQTNASLSGSVAGTLPIYGVSISKEEYAPGDLLVSYELTASALQLTGDLSVGGDVTVAKDCDGETSLCGSVFASGTVGLEVELTVDATLRRRGTREVIDGFIGTAHAGIYGSLEFAYEFCDDKPSCWSWTGSAYLEAGLSMEFPAAGVNFSTSVSTELWSEDGGSCNSDGDPSGAASSGSDEDGYEVIIDVGDWWGEGPAPVVPSEDHLWESIAARDIAAVLGFASVQELRRAGNHVAQRKARHSHGGSNRAEVRGCVWWQRGSLHDSHIGCDTGRCPYAGCLSGHAATAKRHRSHPSRGWP